MKIISWNTNRRVRQAADQARALLGRQPDVVALQEVTRATAPLLRKVLAAGGLIHCRTTVEEATPTSGPRTMGVLVASRFALAAEAIDLSVPWAEKALSVIVVTPDTDIEVHTVHVPPGSSNGWAKIDVLEAVFAGLARHSSRPRLLCGDFNTPQCELRTGEVVTWGQRISKRGRVRVCSRRRGGDGLRWDAAERNLLVGLLEFGMQDAYRTLHGYESEAFSWVLSRKGREFRRRFDHLFASTQLSPVYCAYIDEWRTSGLSDHAAIEACLQVNAGFKVTAESPRS